jgi:hypothetical protein
MKLVKCFALSALNAGSDEEESQRHLKELRSSCAEVMRLQTSQTGADEGSANEYTSTSTSCNPTISSQRPTKIYDILDSLNQMDWLKVALSYNKVKQDVRR